MRARLDLVGTIFGGSFDLPAGLVSMTQIETADGPRIAVTDYGFSATQVDYRPGVTQILNVTGNGPAQVSQTDWHTIGRTDLPVSGVSGSLADVVLDVASMAQAAGTNSAQTVYLAPGGHQGDAASLLTVDVAGNDITFVASANGEGVSVFQTTGSGALSHVQTLLDTNDSYMSQITDMAHVQVGSHQYLFVSSASEHGISGYRIETTGQLTPSDHLGREQSLPVQTVTALGTAEVAGQNFLIAAASGSSSLSVMAVGADGTLTVTDHVLDSLGTRFAGVGQLEVISVDGFTFVLAAGMDDGLSLFTLTPNGQLVHLDSLPDSAGAALDGVSGLAAQAVSGGFEILTTAAGEAGLTLFRVNLPNLGEVMAQASGTLTGTNGDDILSLSTGIDEGAGTLIGGAGDDILSDGAGSDVLTGGAGADTFLMAGDGQRDVITDIQVGVDTLDLSSWGQIYSVSQITVQSTAWGAILRFQDEELELRTLEGTPLDADDVALLLPQILSRMDVVIGPLQQDEVSPEPEPELPDPDRRLIGTDGDDFLVGGSGNDYLNGSAGNDTLYGGEGNDQLGGSNGYDMIFGGPGNDLAGGGDQNDTMDAGAGNDWFSGGWGDDVVMGNTGDDKLAGSFDNDTVQGGAGNDSLGGGMGRDLLEGEDGNDVIGAGEGDDTLYGGQGHDKLNAADGNDQLFGGVGNDTLNGGHGNDTMLGGDGADVFMFNNYVSSGTDIILDFELGTDSLRLIGLDLGREEGRLDKLNLTDSSYQGEAGVWIEFGSHQIFLDGVKAADLSLDDFLFS